MASAHETYGKSRIMQNRIARDRDANTNETELDVQNAYEHTDGSTREIPPDFSLESVTVFAGWRFWNVGNRFAGKERRPVRP